MANNNNMTSATQQAILGAGSKDCPPMLTPDSYIQWKSRIMRYINLKQNCKLIKQCIYEVTIELQSVAQPSTP